MHSCHFHSDRGDSRAVARPHSHSRVQYYYFIIISHMGPKHKAKLAKLQMTCERLQPQWQCGGGRLSGCRRPTGAEARSYHSCPLLSMPDMSNHAVMFD